MQLFIFSALSDVSQGPSVLQSLFGGPFQMSLINVKAGKPRMPISTANSFDILSNDDIDEELENNATVVDLTDLIKPPSPNKLKSHKRKAKSIMQIGNKSNVSGECIGLPGVSRQRTRFMYHHECCGDCDKLPVENTGEESVKFANAHDMKLMDINHVINDSRKLDDECITESMLNIANFTANKVGRRQCANMFNKVARTQVLMPVCQKEELKTKIGKFEILTAVVDSGATVPVMSPNTGASYGIIPSSANGTEYEIASGDTLEDLGEKRMAVLTAEGTLRGYSTRCADVTKSLQAVRALVATNHAVCFGLGAGDEHLIINKHTGEVNRMRDDGINYFQDLIIVPPEQVDRVAGELAAIQAAQSSEDSSGGGLSDFGRPGR